ncbi:hypothetical protein CANMA_001919 [Candida margitis]|uniref:uncharacterized protein n=1 Tax=Candida margitis TaxID=1775924 RepID=UPI002226F07C|nr:uncharacterized protein CANMA_001919 [Candida margitis]KAI5969029.1 hypothetical protein CANMA_001919 [Candida margitis]
MSSASYQEKCNDATQVANTDDNKQEAASVPAQTINHDSKVNEHNIESQPPPTSVDQMDKLQVEEMKQLASQSVGGNITRLGNGGGLTEGVVGSRNSLSHLNNEDNDKKSVDTIRYVTSDDTDKNNENLRK